MYKKFKTRKEAKLFNEQNNLNLTPSKLQYGKNVFWFLCDDYGRTLMENLKLDE